MSTDVILSFAVYSIPTPVAARSKAWVYGHSLAGIASLNPAGTWMSVSCDFCVLSGRCLCDVPITRPEESYRTWCVWVRSRNLNSEES